MFTLLLVLQILVSISIITLVLLQQGKGADMGAGFGAGASGTVFGARGSGSFFTRATAILAAVFFINCLLIASPLVLHVSRAPDSVVEQIEQQKKAATPEESGATPVKPKGPASDLPEAPSEPVVKPSTETPPGQKPAAAAAPTGKPVAVKQASPGAAAKTSETPKKKKADDLPE
jgi:preprotein translocase subunit SecG